MKMIVMKPTEEPCDEKKLLYGKCARNICLHLYIHNIHTLHLTPWFNIIAIRVDNLRVELGARSQGITVTHYTERISLF